VNGKTPKYGKGEGKGDGHQHGRKPWTPEPVPIAWKHTQWGSEAGADWDWKAALATTCTLPVQPWQKSKKSHVLGLHTKITPFITSTPSAHRALPKCKHGQSAPEVLGHWTPTGAEPTEQWMMVGFYLNENTILRSLEPADGVEVNSGCSAWLSKLTCLTELQHKPDWTWRTWQPHSGVSVGTLAATGRPAEETGDKLGPGEKRSRRRRRRQGSGVGKAASL